MLAVFCGGLGIDDAPDGGTTSPIRAQTRGNEMDDKQLERLRRVAESLEAEFYNDARFPYIYTARWVINVSFEDSEIAEQSDDNLLKQMVIDRTIEMLQDQIEHLKSLQ